MSTYGDLPGYVETVLMLLGTKVHKETFNRSYS